MSKSNHMLNHSFKKIAIISLLSLTPMGITLQVQADDTVKKPTVPVVVQSQSLVVNSVNINNASAEDLADALEGVGLEKAKAIVAWRQKNGQFKQIDDLLKVKGIGEKTLAANVGRIDL
jgi:competence ComEA-like helix-hairpin-helix protein